MKGNSDSIAAAWVAKRAGDHWGAAEESSLEQWLSESTRNRVAFIRAQAGWNGAARLKALSAGVAPGMLPKVGAWNFSPLHEPSAIATAAPVSATEVVSERGNGRAGLDEVPLNGSSSAAVPVPSGTHDNARRRALQLRALAASLLLAMAVATWSMWPSGPSYQTPIGGLASVPLADGSMVTLGTDSKIRVELTKNERRVNLDRGEAFFEVAKDRARPFVVRVGEQRVVAVGTRFSVRRDVHDIRVVVAEGKVRVEDDGAGHALPVPLAGGDIARTGRSGTMVQTRAAAQVEESLSWRSGYLVFRDVTIAEAVEEFNRYNQRKIIVSDSAVGTMRVGGKFRSSNVGGFLRLLEAGYPVRVEQRDERAVTIVLAKQY